MSYNPKDPHALQHFIYSGADPDTAGAAMIMVHGRGATADSIMGLSAEIDSKKILFTAPEARGNTWYPHSFLAPVEMNEPSLTSALNVIKKLIESLLLKGFTQEKIFLLGFSQGACLVLEYCARNAKRYAGIIGLSGGLIGEILNQDNYKGNFDGTPVFLGCSDTDMHIPLKRVNETEEVFDLLNARVTKKIYPSKGHTIFPDEIKVINVMLRNV